MSPSPARHHKKGEKVLCVCCLMYSFKKRKEAGYWWLTLVILATLEAEIRRIEV
jgi:hypothetical protein